jgi:DNA-binding NtrC family response regulator
MTTSILIVEDDKATAWALAQGLADVGYLMTTVTSGEEGLACVVRERFQLVIADVRLPDMDGVDLVRRLMETDPELPVILITAYGTPELIEEACVAGAAEVFEKPFRLDDIRSTAAALLETNPAQRSRAA